MAFACLTFVCQENIPLLGQHRLNQPRTMKPWIPLLLCALQSLLPTPPRLASQTSSLSWRTTWAGRNWSCYGNKFNETPYLDQMAKEGVRFTQAYAAAPVCSPYRAALLTGQHPARLNILDYLRPNSSNALPTSHVTLPEVLQQNGYATGMVGKWHLTGTSTMMQSLKSGRKTMVLFSTLGAK